MFYCRFFFYHTQLCVVLLDLVAGGLLNARVCYLRFAFTKQSVTSLRRLYAMMFAFFLLIWSIVRYLVFALTKKVGDVIHDMVRLYLPITKKSMTSLRRFYGMMFAFFLDLVNC